MSEITSNQSVKEPKIFGPRLSVPVPDSQVRKTFLLKRQLSSLLSEYTSFLSEHHSRRIDESLVVETLITKLAKDRHFKVWKALAQR